MTRPSTSVRLNIPKLSLSNKQDEETVNSILKIISERFNAAFQDMEDSAVAGGATTITQVISSTGDAGSGIGTVFVVRAQEVTCDDSDVANGYKDLPFTSSLASAYYTPVVWMKDEDGLDISVTPSMPSRTVSGFRVLGIIKKGTIYYAAIPYN